MKFNRLRLTGFKSFCEPTDFVIEPGLTGVVGPNGCGKSNLVEALRWVMGENSYKSMRASGMDDVIFSGSGNRPSRNTAEVMLVLDNADRSAPAAFNDADLLEISRRIERESGSTYRFNGKEVRARDVQLLFADAATGARSPAMVRQGMIGEIISAKPQQRRRILEDAAGVAGLHSRRHEAELRLKGAEDNLNRLEDVMKQLDSQVDSLKRQARQATRYKGLAAEIRRSEALLLHIAHRDVTRNMGEAESKLEADTREVEERTRHQAEAARLQAIAAYELPPLRDEEAKAGAALQRLILAREQLEGEEERAKQRVVELERRQAQLEKDMAREKALIDDAAGVLGRLDAEVSDLDQATETAGDMEYEAKEKLADAEGRLAETETTLGEAQAALSDINARRNALQQALNDDAQRLQRFERELAQVAAELETLRAAGVAEDEFAALAEALEGAQEALSAAEEAALEAEGVHSETRAAESEARTPLADADRKAHRLETEVRTLSKLLATAESDLWPPVVDEINVAKGYEAALGAALGDDLDASVNASAPAHWSLLGDHTQDAPLPPGVESLAKLVTAPTQLARRLNQIGVVVRTEGAQLQKLLKPGQRLVSKEGDLWRWDGFVAAAEAPTPAARRLVERNRLGDLTREAEEARRVADGLKAQADQMVERVRVAAMAETQTRNDARNAQRVVGEAREALNAAERKRAQSGARVSALEEASNRLTQSRDEALAKNTEAQTALETLTPTLQLTGKLDRARASAAHARAETAEARAAVQSLAREAQVRQQRLMAINNERQSWDERRNRATGQITDYEERIAEAREELETLAEAPELFLERRRALIGEVDKAEGARKLASDKRTEAETRLTDSDRLARMALDAMSAVREERARSEARVEALRQRHQDIVHSIATDLECEPHAVAALAGVGPDDALPESADVERKLEELKQDRERLGAVNLRADDELGDIEGRRDSLTSERDDLTEAIRKLRTAIQSLNKEGRERLVAAFDIVNNHFKDLFTSLFGGGAAELQLIESDDPLEAGLEIMARPPGKKPTTMTLLSGGEQALTAMSLIFAVFLTNPSPICVLDEVDAPLDDSNVERFCDLLAEMRKKTDTRFITITHNPITMARMDRLFGVTMAERGVSQLVSVDLAEAEVMVAAE
ncbi:MULTISPECIES: chromosome segregation protein SMC [unclassified Beijerinckia]|uniref:chromosome segregation protein SMC n=1 Tax=unclassified Beijerinckia TaxID=2638183 RepID=UPI000897538C|nr:MULTISPECIES: chromosome segregation protein SMC [unclassified Beijerinckia]MDH7796715.1 chromosome segregation protein [Beijerinckia sp. GAS462]SEC56901.1 condensin subunit Smc [Beijerinckia sp. 28-YEA-48]